MTRIEMIELKRMNDDAAAVARKIYWENKRNELVRKINGLKNRLNEMYEVGYKLYENGYKLGREYINGSRANVTDGTYHEIGFYVNYPQSEPNGFYGIRCGGAWGNTDLIIDMRTANVISGNYEELERFVKGFDKAESDFYAYVDKLVKC